MQGVRLQGRAPVPATAPIGDVGAAGVDDHHRADHEQRPPARVDLARREPEQPPKRAPGDHEAGDDEDRRLAERGEVLGLAVTIGVTRIGGAPGDAERDEGQDRRDEVGSGVRRLREQAETVRGDPCQELDRNQQAGGDDRDKRGTSLGGHDAEGSHNARGPLSRASQSS